MDELTEFLGALKLDALVGVFEAEALELDDLADLTAAEWGALGIKLGHKKRILKALESSGRISSIPSGFHSSGGATPAPPAEVSQAVSDQQTRLPGGGSTQHLQLR